MLTRHASVLLLLLATACTSVPVTPAHLATAAAEDPDKSGPAQALELWGEALELANRFLASGYRETLDAGHFELTDDGMLYLTADASYPLSVRVTTWGNLCLSTGFEAQERSWGFVVGERGAGSALIANSLFRVPDSARDSEFLWRGPGSLAELILHETTHTVFAVGTVSFWKGFTYYLEAIFLFRYSNHSAERLPFATSAEFARWFHQGPLPQVLSLTAE